ncbi:DUF6708 domain-containing protein [Morganella psychrotolerans]|uniref:DUF6708 domain-containing protein n=1 Tax=Morganella psychrotolerans TaxID=368603 RepID=UPI0039B0D7B4
MAKLHRVGLLTPFTVNRPLTRQEKQHHYRQGRVKKHEGEAAVIDFETVITMNSSYLEVVDNNYANLGQVSSLLMVFEIMIITLIIAIIINAALIPILIVSVMFIPLLILFGKFLLMEWFRKTHYPVRFNRKEQLVHVYQTNNDIITVGWRDIYFSTYEFQRNYCLVGHLLDNDNETVLNTFGFGHTGSKLALDHYWEFIRCYMEEDCLKELADTVILCPPIAQKKESYTFGLQYIVRMDSRLEWPFAVLMFPIHLMESIARTIAMKTSKIPQWSQDVLDACIVSPDDPINVNAEKNPQNLWQYVLANEKIEVYQPRYDRQESANLRIREKLENKRKSLRDRDGQAEKPPGWRSS